jgi:hypothetical protein
LEKVNEFFDCLNGRHSLQCIKTKNGNLAPYRSVNDPRFKKLEDFLLYLNDWKKEVFSLPGLKNEERAAMLLSTQTLKGIAMTVRGFIGVAKFLLGDTVRTKFLMAGVFNQDPLEQYFSKHRAALGGSRNPTYYQYQRNQVNLHILRGLRFKRARGNTTEISSNSTPGNEPLPKRRKVNRSLQETFQASVPF